MTESNAGLHTTFVNSNQTAVHDYDHRMQAALPGCISETSVVNYIRINIAGSYIQLQSSVSYGEPVSHVATVMNYNARRLIAPTAPQKQDVYVSDASILLMFLSYNQAWRLESKEIM